MTAADHLAAALGALHAERNRLAAAGPVGVECSAAIGDIIALLNGAGDRLRRVNGKRQAFGL